MRLILIASLLAACGSVQHCPPQTAQVALECKAAVLKGLKTKEQCYTEIEESCP